MVNEDARWMRRALKLAHNSFATPNPMVGCVLVRNGVIVGEGWTQPVGQAHAEAMALRDAGEHAKGAVAYVTLEPCCHWGRTPPCSDALIAAGIVRVVAATLDSNPRVGGQGIAQLRAAGIDVTVGVLEPEARAFNEAFFYFQETHTPFVTLKTAMTLDGKIATRTGNSQWITGAISRRYVHTLRAQAGAVMVGIETLLADDAQLTARLPNRALPRQPMRIIVDSQLRTPPTCRAVRAIGQAETALEQGNTDVGNVPTPLLIATTEQADSEREDVLRQAGAELVRLPATENGRVNLTALMKFLASRQIASVLVEGGGELNAALLADKLAHKMLCFVAPKLIGGRDAPTPIEGGGIAQMSNAILLDKLTIRRFGADIALEGRIQPSDKNIAANERE